MGLVTMADLDPRYFEVMELIDATQAMWRERETPKK